MVDKSITAKANTALNLGLTNLARVATYRLGVKSGMNPVTRLEATLPSGTFFADTDLPADAGLSERLSLKAFGYIPYHLEENKPNWFYSPLTQKVFKDVETVWYKIPDFDDSIGDIKGVWEASRFDWLIKFVEYEHHYQDGRGLVTLDSWLNDWCEKNPAYLGPNWKCGQEASIRVMHLVTALIGLGKLHSINDNLLSLIEIHLKRIAPTLSYAIAQDNNHGTSEAVALYIGGAVLNETKPSKRYLDWQHLGEKWLSNRANKLIMKDGGFSQYSVNYHRVMLDSYCLAEIVRCQLQLPALPKKVYQRLSKATDWLYVLVQDNGDAPNLGANDGAKLLPIGQSDYRDFRPTVQLASTLFNRHSYYQTSASYDEGLNFFGIDKLNNKRVALPNKSQLFASSGIMTRGSQNFFICFKIPKFKFRPSQCDALHVDLWFKGDNVLRDGGTFSYNTTTDDLDYYSGVESHNTVQFDNHLQMPRLSRFLFASWLKPLTMKYRKNTLSSSYKDEWSCQHSRAIKVQKQQIVVTDEIQGFKDHAVLRWRLMPDQWVLKGDILSNGKMTLEIHSKSALKIRMVEGRESRYYYQETSVPVLEVTVIEPTTIHTTIKDIT